MRAANYWVLLIGAPALIACSSSSALLDPPQWWQAYSGGARPAPVVDPAFRYLRVDTGGRTSYLVFGDADSPADGSTEVYYSALGEVVRLREGRIVGSAGLPVDWRAVRQGGAPDWRAVLATSATDPAPPRDYLRVRDVMPGYRFGVRETVVVRSIAAPQLADAVTPRGVSLRWFEESISASDAQPVLPPARFAVDAAALPPRVVYSEQCLAADYCLRLQAWPPAADNAPVSTGRAQ